MDKFAVLECLAIHDNPIAAKNKDLRTKILGHVSKARDNPNFLVSIDSGEISPAERIAALGGDKKKKKGKGGGAGSDALDPETEQRKIILEQRIPGPTSKVSIFVLKK